MRNVAIYVEGYHDRDFLSGWLLGRGWKDPGQRRGARESIVNPVTRTDVKGGRYGFQSPTGSTFVGPRCNHPQLRVTRLHVARYTTSTADIFTTGGVWLPPSYSHPVPSAHPMHIGASGRQVFS
jgi:hypothetical protein